MARLRTLGSVPCQHRRDLLKLGVACGALLIADPMCVLDSVLDGPADQVASRTSVLVPNHRLAHADLHTHSLLSDGTGDPEQVFQAMRQAGLDVAALTDHTTCPYVTGIDDDAWRRTEHLADQANIDGQFVALRGFEWSEPYLGHITVWFTEQWIDSEHEAAGLHGVDRSAAGGTLDLGAPEAANHGSMRRFYEWLRAPPSRSPLGGGGDGLAGFSHPGIEPGLFNEFAYDRPASDHIVGIEVFNQGADYLFQQIDGTGLSPINDALNKGWRLGLLGVSDHHGTTWGREDGLGRTGLWVKALTRDGVYEALARRRFFASLVNGIRFAVTANGVLMGGTLYHRRGPIRFEIDVSRGPTWHGKTLSVQILAPGNLLPRILTSQPIKVPDTDGETVALTIDVDADEAPWLLVRLSDPTRMPDQRATGQYTSLGGAVAYSSPFWLLPA